MLRETRVRLRRVLGDDMYARVKLLFGADLHYTIQMKRQTEMHGTTYGGWTILSNVLSKSSIVYSAGVGEDISFDLSIIEKFGLYVHAFDPTPACGQWIKSQLLPEQFVFHNCGIASFDGQACMQPVGNSRDISQTIMKTPGAQREIGSTKVCVKRLMTAMHELGHSSVDVLKMDIEGAEYEVVDDILDNGIRISQILVEFHHFLRGTSIRRTRRAIKRLMQNGYRLFYVDPRKAEFSFAKHE